VSAAADAASVEAASVCAVWAGAAVEDLSGGLRSLVAAGVPFSAEAVESAEALESVEVAESAVSAGAVFRSASRLLSPEVIVCRLPCRSLLRLLFPAEPDEPVDRPFALPIVSAGSGTALLVPACVVSSSPAPADAAVAVSAESEEGESPELKEEERPLAPLPRCDAPERELSALVRDDDMMPLSTMVSVASPSGSAVRLGGAMMSGG